jgi:hypothetical protein
VACGVCHRKAEGEAGVTFFHCGQFNDSGTGAALALDQRLQAAGEFCGSEW